MYIAEWLSYITAAIVIAYTLSLLRWTWLIFHGDDPMDCMEDVSWSEWLVLFYALLGIEFPLAVVPVMMLLSVIAGTTYLYLGIGCAGSIISVTVLYLYVQWRADRKFDERMLSLRRNA